MKETYPTTIECEVSYEVNDNGFREVFVEGRHQCWIHANHVEGPPKPPFVGLQMTVSGEPLSFNEETTRCWAELNPDSWSSRPLDKMVILACQKIVKEYDGENDR